MGLRDDADFIINASIASAMPGEAVKRALDGKSFGDGKLVLISIGKGGWQMAHSAWELLGERIDSGVVITKYDHVKGELGRLRLFEAGHPVPDENSFKATQAAIDAVAGLTSEDTVLFLVSGGGSALFEKPLITSAELTRLTKELLACGGDIVEMNTIRKRFSAVKGGRFARLCAPAKVFSVVLSDVIDDRLDMIASGPAYPDSSTAQQALDIVKKYNLTMTPAMIELLEKETPKVLDNVETIITGSVRQLCDTAATVCQGLGYRPILLSTSLCCVARDAGSFMASIARTHARDGEALAFIAGGETVVNLTGKGLGGRNQELALSAAEGIDGLDNVAVFSVGSDGTDGPTDAAGGYADGTTQRRLREQGISIFDTLRQNDSYHALELCGGLVITGATGTNVNDLSVLLIR